jgi:hypothetical protein
MSEKGKGKVKEVSSEELAQRLGGSRPEDRRTSERVPAQLEVDIPLGNWEEFRRVYTTNISKGGLLFTITGPASVPAELELKLALPDGQTVTLAGEVRHVKRKEETKEFEVGVQFKLEQDAQAKLDGALEKIGKA